MYIGESFPIYYTSKNFTSGVSTKLLIQRPDGNAEGLYTMVEFSPTNFKGIYKYDYTPTMEGEYFFIVFQNSTWKATSTEFSEERPFDPTDMEDKLDQIYNRMALPEISFEE